MVCLLIVLKCLYLARIGRPDITWAVKKLVRVVTKWTQACDIRLARWISCIHHTSEHRQHCLVATRHSTADRVFSKTQTFLATLRTQSQPRGCPLYIRKPNICPHQLDVQEADISIPQFYRIRYHVFGLRMDGLPALDLWDIVNEVLRSTNNTPRHDKLAQGNLVQDRKSNLSNCQMWTTYTQTHTSVSR